MSNYDFTEEERKRIVKDIVNHHIEEVVVGSGDDITYDEIEEFESEVRESSDNELRQFWNSVGEWVASRNFDPDEQFQKLRESGDVDYGYRSYKYDQPY